MNTYIKELTDEAREILTNIQHAAEQGDITWQQRDELKRIVLRDVADAAGLATARELLAAWS